MDGSQYSDDYGPRGSGFHYGIDMLAPTGTPTWAVKSGGVHYTLESAGGLVAYLYADDGNVYYYAHMSEIIGDGNRGVGQGELPAPARSGHHPTLARTGLLGRGRRERCAVARAQEALNWAARIGALTRAWARRTSSARPASPAGNKQCSRLL